MLTYRNKMGRVALDADVFAALAAAAAAAFKDRAVLTDPKGRPVSREKLSAPEKADFTEVSPGSSSDSIRMEVYMIVKFGISISSFAEEYAYALRTLCREATGIYIEQIAVNITGVRSKKTARRELRILC